MTRSRTRREAALLSVMLLVFLVTAFFSDAPFHPNEYFQTLEWTGHKLGVVDASDLSWEFGAKIRPWLLPAIYFALAKIWTTFFDVAKSATTYFAFATFARIASSLFSFYALFRLFDFSKRWVPDSRQGLHALVFTTAGMLPYLAARTSSENVATSFFLLAFVQLAGDRRLEGYVLALSGFALGLSFECRFQMAFLALGLLAHRLYSRPNERFREASLIVGGGLFALLLAAFIDRWGYGTFSSPPFAYARMNIAEGRAATFGTSPFFAYPYLTIVNVFFPAAIVLVVALVLIWIRHPRHVLTWTTLPFFLAHSLIGHKEERFLFPLVPLVVAGFLLATLPETSPRGERWLRFMVRRRAVILGVWGYQLAVMIFLAFIPFGWRPNVELSKRIVEENVPLPLDRVGTQRFQNYFFLQNGRHLFADAPPIEHLDEGTRYFLARSPTLTSFDGKDVELVATQAPLGAFGRNVAESVRAITAHGKRTLGFVPEIGCPTLYRVREKK